MLAFLGFTGSLAAAAVGGYILHMFLPLATLKAWAAKIPVVGKWFS
jgi:hypothetical protein